VGSLVLIWLRFEFRSRPTSFRGSTIYRLAIIPRHILVDVTIAVTVTVKVALTVGLHLYFRVTGRSKERGLEPKNTGIWSFLQVGA
jgi:hypothetical protein